MDIDTRLRYDTLNELCGELDGSVQDLIKPMLEDLAFIECQLSELRKLPFIRVNPNDPSQQKATPAAKMYKELLQQYNNCIKIMLGVLGKIDNGDISPLREYLSARAVKAE